MTYKELQINSEIKLKEKKDTKRASHRMVKYIVVAKYPNMCIIEDGKGRRRGAAVGELIMNKIITQEPVFESLRKEGSSAKASRGWHKKDKPICKD